MSRVILLIVAFSCLTVVNGQRIFRSEYDSMRASLNASVRDTTQLFTLLRMAEFHIAMNGEFAKDLDSAAGFIGQARKMNMLVGSRTAEGYITLVQSLLDAERQEGRSAAEKENQQAVDILQHCGNPLLLGKALAALSHYLDYRNPAELKAKIVLMEKSLSCFERVGDPHLEGDCLEQLADMYFNDDQLSKAEEDALLAIERYRKAGYPNLQGAATILSSAYSSQFDLTGALKYALIAVDAIKATQDTTAQVCQVDFITGVLYGKLGDWENSIVYHQAALDWAREHHHMADVYIVLHSFVGVYGKVGHPEKAVELVNSIGKAYGMPRDSSFSVFFTRDNLLAYSSAGRFAEARSWYERLRKLTGAGFELQLHTLYAGMQYAILSKQYSTADELEPAFRERMRYVSDSFFKASCYKWLFRLDTGQHRYDQAVQDLLKCNHLGDSILNITKMRQIQRLQLDYSTAEKEHSIKMLQKETEIQKKDISYSRQARNYSIAGAVALLLVGFGRYRLKHRQNLQLAVKQREITQQNEQLEKLLRENEWLLREVHHRVKNNLQIVTSLLGSQSAGLRDETAVKAVMESQYRVQSMALIHQKLYKSENFASVRMDEYVGDMVEYLRECVRPGLRIVFDVRVEDIVLDVARAVPVGLILNELVTNSIKYAFPFREDGRIIVEFRRVLEGMLSLVVMDDGIGLPPDLDVFESPGFGMRLIRGLAGDLEASVEVVEGEGTGWRFLMEE